MLLINSREKVEINSLTWEGNQWKGWSAGIVKLLIRWFRSLLLFCDPGKSFYPWRKWLVKDPSTSWIEASRIVTTLFLSSSPSKSFIQIPTWKPHICTLWPHNACNFFTRRNRLWQSDKPVNMSSRFPTLMDYWEPSKEASPHAHIDKCFRGFRAVTQAYKHGPLFTGENLIEAASA